MARAYEREHGAREAGRAEGGRGGAARSRSRRPCRTGTPHRHSQKSGRTKTLSVKSLRVFVRERPLSFQVDPKTLYSKFSVLGSCYTFKQIHRWTLGKTMCVSLARYNYCFILGVFGEAGPSDDTEAAAPYNLVNEQSGHVNLFADAENEETSAAANRKENQAYHAEKKQDEETWQKKVGILKYLGNCEVWSVSTSIKIKLS